ncbi:MAG: SDR family oxidoreductase [Alphaproteobacteria bacterium]|nr:SDR family oxidoreductase [Alphaproteobacteria bacterium]
MKVVITGAAGFLGKKLSHRLAGNVTLTGRSGKPEAITKVTLFDVVEPEGPSDKRFTKATGDVADRSLMSKLIDEETDSVFHLAGVVSAGAEADFDLGYHVNLDGTLAVLDTMRKLPHAPRIVFTSSLATYGGEYNKSISDDTPQTPQTSYGVQKTIGELLINDYSRKGFIDGRSLKLPTIFVRPGKPNKAASTFASSIVRDPLQGTRAVCPVTRDVKMAFLSPRRTIDAFIHAHELSGEAWGPWRSCMLPAITYSIDEVVKAMEKLAGSEPVKRIDWVPDPVIQKIVATWPGTVGWDKAKRLGFKADSSIEEIIQAFIDEDMVKAA